MPAAPAAKLQAAYLLGVQAGFQIWEQNQSMVSSSYSVSIN